MLIRKGTSVSFVLAEGGVIGAPRGALLLHDPSGRFWNECSALFLRVPTHGGRAATSAEVSGAPEDYFGRGYKAHVVEIDLPPRRLGAWTRIGSVEEIRYSRQGYKGRGRWFHPFGKRSASSLYRAGKLPILYKRGNAMRLELGEGCHWDDRGFVFP